jgi:hypothetical protein
MPTPSPILAAVDRPALGVCVGAVSARDDTVLVIRAALALAREDAESCAELDAARMAGSAGEPLLVVDEGFGAAVVLDNC